MIGKILSDMTEVGYYEQAQKIVKMALTLITSLGTVVSPRISNVVSNGKEEEVKYYISNSFNFVWFLGIPVMLGVMAISFNMIPWFLGEEFTKCISLIMIGAPLIMAIGLNNVTGVQYLLATKKQNIFTKSVIVGALFNFFFNLIFINVLKSLGATIASVLAETLILVIQLKYIKNEIPINLVLKNCKNYLISGSIMFILTFVIGLFMRATIFTTIIQIIIGGSIYIVSLFIMKDEFLFKELEKIKYKFVKGEA